MTQTALPDNLVHAYLTLQDLLILLPPKQAAEAAKALETIQGDHLAARANNVRALEFIGRLDQGLDELNRGLARQKERLQQPGKPWRPDLASWQPNQEPPAEP